MCVYLPELDQLEVCVCICMWWFSLWGIHAFVCLFYIPATVGEVCYSVVFLGPAPHKFDLCSCARTPMGDVIYFHCEFSVLRWYLYSQPTMFEMDAKLTFTSLMWANDGQWPYWPEHIVWSFLWTCTCRVFSTQGICWVFVQLNKNKSSENSGIVTYTLSIWLDNWF